MDKIELLSVKNLDKYRNTVSEFEELSKVVKHGLGWHYLLDLSWAANELQEEIASSAIVLDAGASHGLMQWFLAGHGVTVISVDIVSRYELPEHIRSIYHISGLRKIDFRYNRPKVTDFLPSRSPRKWLKWPGKLAHILRWSILPPKPTAPGKVIIYNQNLANMTDIPSNSVDAIVSISALEHNSPEELKNVINELLRTLKPGGKILATLGAARDMDWFHEPSRGWCYTEATLRELFQLSQYTTSNFSQYDTSFKELCQCKELELKLGEYYKKPGNHGMPTGKWIPEYHIVGVVKYKPVS